MTWCMLFAYIQSMRDDTTTYNQWPNTHANHELQTHKKDQHKIMNCSFNSFFSGVGLVVAVFLYLFLVRSNISTSCVPLRLPHSSSPDTTTDFKMLIATKALIFCVCWHTIKGVRACILVGVSSMIIQNATCIAMARPCFFFCLLTSNMVI